MIDYKRKAEKNKQKIINKNVKKFKKLCMKEFQINIKKGLNQTIVDFFDNVTYAFQEEISIIVLKELKQENPHISFEFSYRHCYYSYKGIQINTK